MGGREIDSVQVVEKEGKLAPSLRLDPFSPTEPKREAAFESDLFFVISGVLVGQIDGYPW